MWFSASHFVHKNVKKYSDFQLFCYFAEFLVLLLCSYKCKIEIKLNSIIKILWKSWVMHVHDA